MTKILKEHVLRALLRIQKDGPVDLEYGICYQVDCHIGRNYDSKTVYDVITHYSESWPDYSGHPSYPIPSLNKTLSAENYYDDRDGKWAGRQGKLRNDLVDHIIAKIQEELEAHNPVKEETK
jgi:hypothetical protein